MKITKHQKANRLAATVISELSQTAANIKRLLEKGTHQDGSSMGISPKELRDGFSAEQLEALGTFQDLFYDEPEKKEVAKPVEPAEGKKGSK